MSKWLEVKCRDWATVKRVNKWLAKTQEFSRPGVEELTVAIMDTMLTPAEVITALGTDGILGIGVLETSPPLRACLVP